MERSAWPKNLSSSRKRAIKELLHAQKPTKKLRDLFDAHSQAGNNTGQSLFSEDLVGNVVRSFSNTLSLSRNAQSDEVLQLPTNACVMSEVSEKSESIMTPVPRIPARTMAIQVLDPTISFAIPLNQAQFIASRYYTHHHLNLIGSRFNWSPLYFAIS
ncbi:uncharacterized protein LOC115677169 [Syzygium oleosum]|uniref:uncharacterized protein LOC115677169 n=1 Tax=Syzygium oleosum TaxID=219896 RepID=UPI0011D1EA70|nr:uncharacterized protein LOC115677169 [Syzygium oleosum]